MQRIPPPDNSLIAGDCLEVMRHWPDACIDHCITDPPYNMSKKNGLSWAFSSHVTMSEEWDQMPRSQYLQFTRRWLKEVSRVVKPNGNIFIFGSYHNIYDIGYTLNEMELKVNNSITWFKPNAQPNITTRMLTESTEHIIWACNASRNQATGWTFNYKLAKKFNGGKQLRNVWTIPYPSPSERHYGKHPSQKPLDLITRLVLIASSEGDIILDPFAGSGTTGVVAQSFERRYVMIEQHEEYHDIAARRLQKVRAVLPPELSEEAEQTP